MSDIYGRTARTNVKNSGSLKFSFLISYETGHDYERDYASGDILFGFYDDILFIRLIRQIRNAFIPLYFHWSKAIKSSNQPEHSIYRFVIPVGFIVFPERYPSGKKIILA